MIVRHSFLLEWFLRGRLSEEKLWTCGSLNTLLQCTIVAEIRRGSLDVDMLTQTHV